MAHEIQLPFTSLKLTSIEEVWYHRRRAAWFLASKLGDVTEASYDDAFDLLDRCKNWAIAQMRFDESETAENVNDPRRIHEGELLERRRVRLMGELRPYNCIIACLGYFSENVYDYDFEKGVITDDTQTHYLHFF